MAAAAAAAFRNLELVMDHNLSVAASASASASAHDHLHRRPLPAPAPEPEPEPEPEAKQEREQEHAHEHPPPLHRFATLSLAFSPILSSPALLTPRSPAAPSPKFAIALPSQKKCISPMPLMPAVSAAAGVVAAVCSPFLGTKRSSKSSTAFPDYQRLPDRSNNFGDPSNGAAARRASIVWFRNDLRCHDNEALFTASKESLSVLPVYCFDPRDYGKSSSGFDKTGPYRAKFLLECVSNLRENLRERGSDLVVRVGKPEEVLASLAKDIGADALYAHQEISCDESQCENKVSAALQKEGVDVNYLWGSTLFHVDDLPFKLEEMPITYSGFREKVQNVKIRNTLETPKQLKGFPVRGGVQPGDIPTLQALGLGPVSAQKQDGASSMIGGEAEALQRLKKFGADHMKQSNNKVVSGACGESLYGSNFSCKISPWLAMGCLSPRRMFEDLKNNGKSVISASAGSDSNDNGLNWLVFELLWRDFFRFITKKYAASKQGSEVITATQSTAAAPI